MTTEETIRAALDAYARQDLEDAMGYCSDTACFILQAAEGNGTWSFDCHDKAAFRDALITINTEFEMLGYELVELIANGNRAATRQNVRFRHRATGRTMETQIADFWTVEDGRITSVHEFADTANIAAHRMAG